MSYDAYELSIQLGQPVELYTFTVGLQTYRYTSAEDTVNFSANPYLPRQIDRTSPGISSTENGRQQMEITIPSDDPIATRYLGIPPAERAYIRIVRFHRGDSPNGWVLWDGRIISAKFEQQGALCRLFSVSSESALARPIPGRKFQGMCNHVLYDGGCKLLEADNRIIGPVLAANGRQIAVSGLPVDDATWALGGKVIWGSDRRLIVAQDGNMLTLQMPFRGNIVGEEVTVTAGCAHTLAVCQAKFDNAINFGGFPFVPTKNPFNTGF